MNGQAKQFLIIGFDDAGQPVQLVPDDEPVATMRQLLGVDGQKVIIRTREGRSDEPEHTGVAFAADDIQGDLGADEAIVEVAASPSGWSAWDDLCPRAQTIVVVMSDLLSLHPIVERAYTEDGSERVLVGICELGAVEPILSATCHPADCYSALLSLLERMGHVLSSPQWRG